MVQQNWVCSYHRGKQYRSWAWYSGDRKQLNLMCEKANLFFGRQKKGLSWGMDGISLRDLCYFSWKEVFRQRTEFTGMGNFHNEFSEQSLLLSYPSKNHSSPFCSTVSLTPSQFGSSGLMTCAPLLVFWGNTVLWQPDFHFSIWLQSVPQRFLAACRREGIE